MSLLPTLLNMHIPTGLAKSMSRANSAAEICTSRSRIKESASRRISISTSRGQASASRSSRVFAVNSTDAHGVLQPTKGSSHPTRPAARPSVVTKEPDHTLHSPLGRTHGTKSATGGLFFSRHKEPRARAALITRRFLLRESEHSGGLEARTVADAPSRQVVLIVEDEALVRMTAVDMIEVAGFEVLEATNADEAILLLEARRDITVVFTDIEMPG